MKIAFLNKYQNIVFRGAETYVSELSKRLAKNHEVDIVSKISYLSLIKKKYDLIIPTNGRLQVIVTRKITWLTGAKMIVSGQSGIGLDDRINLYSFPDAFVALSTKALNWARRISPLIRSVYIPNGVDLRKFTINNSQFRNNIKTILCVGAATAQKRLDLVIKAVAKLDGVKLLIASGGGDVKDEIYKMGKDLLSNRFEMISVSFDEMPEVYKRADVFTLVSESSESFGNVFVEAMASNLPVVVRDDEQRREIIGSAGIFVNPENIDEYANVLDTALNKKWENLPRKQAERFSWDKIALQYEDLIKTLFKK